MNFLAALRAHRSWHRRAHRGCEIELQPLTGKPRLRKRRGRRR